MGKQKEHKETEEVFLKPAAVLAAMGNGMKVSVPRGFVSV